MNHIRLIFAILLSFRLIPHLLFFLCSKNRKVILSDIDNPNNKILYLIYKLTWDVTFRNLFYYRIGRLHFLFSWLCPRCPYMKINQDMPIGQHTTIYHGFCTFLNGKSIGEHFVCYHNVTIGQLKGELPSLGNNVTVSCGASILGNVRIGNNVVIGSGCVVVKNIPDNCVVVGNPARIVRLNGNTVNILL